MKDLKTRLIVDPESNEYKEGYERAVKLIAVLIQTGISVRNCYGKIPEFIDDDVRVIRGFRDGFYETLYKIKTGLVPTKFMKMGCAESVNNAGLLGKRLHTR